MLPSVTGKNTVLLLYGGRCLWLRRMLGRVHFGTVISQGVYASDGLRARKFVVLCYCADGVWSNCWDEKPGKPRRKSPCRDN